MGALKDVRERLAGRVGVLEPHWIPARWNGVGYQKCRTCDERPGEICVDPADFVIANLDWIESRPEPAPWSGTMGSHAVYSLLPRCLTAWDHREKDLVESGTFLKTIALLPWIRSLGVDALYLLPVFDHSERYRKGGLGSPYAVRDFFALARELHDPVLGDWNPELLDLGFRALVEACHRLGMRVLLDFVFRTCARDNVLIREHPDWFYWIDRGAQGAFRPVKVEGLPHNAPPTPENLKRLYETAAIDVYAAQFRHDPRAIDPHGYAAFVARVPKEGDLLGAIEERYGVTTAPAYSDVLNDIQPPWTDVTYLRLDLGRNALAEKRFAKDAPPVILNDGMKLSAIPPGALNEGLCALLKDIIPHYQQTYGIDGARIDMGHALPRELHAEILRRARAIDPDFLLWSEVFHASDSPRAAADGFDMISGTIWEGFLKRREVDYDRRFLRDLRDDALPPMSALETPDTQRAAVSLGDRQERLDLVVVSALLPGVWPMIDGGMEIGEREPMNLGLGESGDWRAILPEGDPMRGKLAFFDTYRLHWTQDDDGMRDQIAMAMALRKDCIDLVGDKANLAMGDGKGEYRTRLRYEKEGRTVVVDWRRDTEKAKPYVHDGPCMTLRYDGAFPTAVRTVERGERLQGRVVVLTN